MAKVLGFGGIFFKCEDNEKLAGWYRDHLGFLLSDFGGTVFEASKLPKNSYAVWGPFANSTEYFKPSEKGFMINLIVDDVDAVLEKAAKGGATVIEEKEDSEFGRFGWFVDPEGNKIELWKPNPNFNKTD